MKAEDEYNDCAATATARHRKSAADANVYLRDGSTLVTTSPAA